MMSLDRGRAIWRTRLGSACRTALACSVVGFTTMYGPLVLTQKLAFPAFSYLTAILIVSDGTLDDALRGSWQAFCATCHVVPLAVLILWLVGPVNFSAPFAAMMVAMASFLVALPECTDILCKRIAFGQIVIVCVGAVVKGKHTDVVMHPVQVALSTGLGALASIVAMLVPYPRLARTELRKLCRSYINIASKRIGLFIEAFSAQDKANAVEAISRAKPIAERGAELLQKIRLEEEGVLRAGPSKGGTLSGDRLQEMETAMTGMEVALSSSPLFPACHISEELTKILQEMDVKKELKPNQQKTSPETNKTPLYKILSCFKTVNTDYENNLAPCFFLSCMHLLEKNSTATIDTPIVEEPKRTCVCPTSERLMFAFKCSLSLMLAVLFGLLFSKENGYWSGLTIAISFSFKRQATFTMANARVQGTAIGSVYGVLGSYFLGKSMELKIVALLPWIIFTSFLRHSHMYGQAGGISAVIGALLILGRVNYGPPAEFAIIRLTEAFIGLLCLTLIEIFCQPTRAATLSRTCLAKTLKILRECVNEMTLSPDIKDMDVIIHTMAKKQVKLKVGVEGLEEMVREAEIEPDFWFSPFKVEIYNKVLKPMSKIKDLMFLSSYEIGSLVLATKNLGLDWKRVREWIDNDMEVFKCNVGTRLDYLEKITISTESDEKQWKKIYNDLEMGMLPSLDACKANIKDEKDIFRHLKETIDEIWDLEGKEIEKSEMVMYLSALVFCIRSFMRETKNVQREVTDLVGWENSSNW